MNQNERLITKFYSSFSKKDYNSMKECYANNATFNDPVFKDLDAIQLKSMWEMLCLKGKDLEIEFDNIIANDHTGSANWKATYSFSATGKKVINHIKAEFTFENGKILKHTDYFNFYNWSSQALGLIGFIFGWTPFLKNKIRKLAMKNLFYFMKQHK